jgi:hypothetical protein
MVGRISNPPAARAVKGVDGLKIRPALMRACYVPTLGYFSTS